ncbi:MAG TPA: hypothetical protein VGO91_11445 [Pyrinomonadaceae bacterium]|jgi:hypothetical protein|nr:hypothetical protein [Pyrinomonadaceae bacterium]
MIFQMQAGGSLCLTQTTAVPAVEASGWMQDKAIHKVNPETLKKYVGRYELETGIIPISTLDVTLEDGDLWIKPSLVKKRRLVRRSKTRFTDELEGALYIFNQDEEGKIASVTFEFEGSSYTAQRVALPAPSLKGNTTFKLKGYADASLVVLAGSFNDWNQSQLIFGREGGEWVCRIDLQPGRYTYKIIVDGNWMLDPSNPDTDDDDYGNKNSVLLVGTQK